MRLGDDKETQKGAREAVPHPPPVLGSCPYHGFEVIQGPRGVPGSGSQLASMAVQPGLMTRESE